MSVREYIGARYVPLFADPLTWDATRTYEPLTVVLYQGNSYTSRQSVPANIDITNTTYWAQTGNYNAQVEQYRQEVQTFDGRITQNTTDIAGLGTSLQTEATARANADTALTNADTALGQRITQEVSDRQSADALLATKAELTAAVSGLASESYVDTSVATAKSEAINESRKKYIIAIGDSWTQNANYWRNAYTAKYNDEIKSYAAGGVGFIGLPSGETKDFPTQLSDAIADATVDKSKVTDIVVMGGINDYTYNIRNTQQLANVIISMNASIKTNYPNATPHFIIGNMNYRDYSAGSFAAQSTDGSNVNQIYIWHQVKFLCSKAGINPTCMYGWLSNKEYKSDMIHPADNGNGANRIAGNVHALIHGGTIAYCPFIIARSTTTVNNKCFMTIKEDEVQMYNWCYVATGAGVQYVSDPVSGFDGTELPFDFMDSNNKGITFSFALSYPQEGQCTLGVSHNRFAFFPYEPNGTVPEAQAGMYAISAVVPIRTDY